MPIVNPLTYIGTGIEYAANGCERASDSIVTYLQEHIVPVRVHHLAKKLIKALPESYYFFAMVTGTGIPVAGAFWTCRLVVVFLPLIKKMLEFDFSGDSLWKALSSSFDNLTVAYERFAPAVFVAATILSYSTYLISLANKDVLTGMQATLFAIYAEYARRIVVA